MVSVSIDGVESVRSMLAGLGGSLEKARKYAQNDLARAVWAAEKDQMRSDLDRPTPWSVGALRYRKTVSATEGSSVFMSDAFHAGQKVDQDDWLGVQIMGGQTAGPRRSEKKLQNAGILPPGKVWVPAKGVRLNRYGNIDGGIISRILMDLQLGTVKNRDGTSHTLTTRTKNFALFGPKNNPIGVLAKIGDSWFPYLFFVDRATYEPKYDFYGRGEREAQEKWKAIYDEQVQKAMEKAARL